MALDTTNALITLNNAKLHLGIEISAAQVVQVTCTNENANTGIGDEYFLISSTIDDYYVWYNVAAGGVDPSVADRTAIPVAVANGASAQTVATATQVAVTAVTGMTATVAGAVVTVTNDTAGSVTAATAGDVGFTVTTAIIGVNGDISDDTLITDLINAQSWYLNSVCDRELLTRSQTEYYDGNGGYVLWLNHPPISAVTLNQDSDRSWASATEIVSTDYVVYGDLGKLILTGTVFLSDVRVVKVVYTGGFSTVPYDLQQACINLVERQYHLLKEGGVANISMSNAGGSVNFDQELPADVQRTIQKYKRYGMIV